MAMALMLFASGKRHYAHEQIRGRVPQTPEQRTEQWKVLSRIAGLFVLTAVWWCAYDMKGDVWIAFADIGCQPSHGQGHVLNQQRKFPAIVLAQILQQREQRVCEGDQYRDRLHRRELRFCRIDPHEAPLCL